MNYLFAFPAEEPIHFCRLALKKYSRSKPGSDVKSTIQGMIRLPMPTQLVDDYNIRVNDVNFDLLGAASGMVGRVSDSLAAGKSGIEIFENELKNGISVLKTINLTAMQAAAIAPGISDTGVGRFLQSQSGMVRNPHLTTIFEGVNLKSYSFTWRLSPTSKEEARQINDIIEYIKTFMHPSISKNSAGFALDYPYIANMDFEVGPVAFSQLPKVRDSFITKIDVNSSSSGVAFFADGHTVSIDLTINLQEINTLTREDFGFGT